MQTKLFNASYFFQGVLGLTQNNLQVAIASAFITTIGLVGSGLVGNVVDVLSINATVHAAQAEVTEVKDEVTDVKGEIKDLNSQFEQFKKDDKSWKDQLSLLLVGKVIEPKP